MVSRLERSKRSSIGHPRIVNWSNPLDARLENSDVRMEGGGFRSLQCDKRDGKGGGLRRSKVVKQVEEKVDNKCNKKEKQVEDKWVQVSLAMSCRCCNNDNTDEGTSNTMIADMINSCCSEDEDDLVPSVAEYEDIAEVAAALLHEENLAIFPDLDQGLHRSQSSEDSTQMPPPLPPRDLAGNEEEQQVLRRRKDLRAHLGLREEEAACLLGVRGGRGGRRKDLTRFLGITQEGAKSRERPKSIIENLLGASRVRRQGMSGGGKEGDHQDQDQLSFQQFVSMLAKEERQIRRAGRVTSRRNPPVRASALFTSLSSTSSSSSSSEESGEEERSSSCSMVSSVAASSCSPTSTPTLPSRTLTISRAGMMSMLRSKRSKRRAEEEEEVRAAMEKGMPVIPFSPLTEGKSIRRGVSGNIRDCGSSSESLDTLIRLAKDQLHSSSISFSSSTSSSSSMEEPIYMEMTGRTPLSISCPPRPCFTDYMDMGVVDQAMSIVT